MNNTRSKHCLRALFLTGIHSVVSTCFVSHCLPVWSRATCHRRGLCKGLCDLENTKDFAAQQRWHVINVDLGMSTTKNENKKAVWRAEFAWEERERERERKRDSWVGNTVLVRDLCWSSNECDPNNDDSDWTTKRVQNIGIWWNLESDGCYRISATQVLLQWMLAHSHPRWTLCQQWHRPTCSSVWTISWSERSPTKGKLLLA